MPIPEIPNRFLCPITLDIMFDPVLAADGRNYERSAIERCLREHNNTSPFTREIINNRLTQNMDLRAETLEFLDLNAHYIHEAIVTLTTQNNHAPFIKALIKRNKDNLNRKDEAGQTPLHIAVINRKTEVINTDSNINIIQLLLREGANYKIRNDQHRTPKKEAKELGFWDVVDLIDNYLMKDTSQMDLSEFRLTTTAIQQQELKTEDAVVRLIDRMQRLTVNQPRFLKFFSWQAMELLALGTTMVGAAVVAQYQRNTTRRFNEQQLAINTFNESSKQMLTWKDVADARLIDTDNELKNFKEIYNQHNHVHPKVQKTNTAGAPEGIVWGNAVTERPKPTI